MIFAGVGLIGIWAGIATSWFLESSEEKQDDTIDELRQEVRGVERGHRTASGVSCPRRHLCSSSRRIGNCTVFVRA